jgi:hypothetical protein
MARQQLEIHTKPVDAKHRKRARTQLRVPVTAFLAAAAAFIVIVTLSADGGDTRHPDLRQVAILR